MRIYNRAAFLLLPAGTMYCQGKPWMFDGICIKGDNIDHDGVPNDWTYLSPEWIESEGDSDQWMKLQEMVDVGASYPMATSYGRDGRFDNDDLFLVFEPDDLAKLAGFVATAKEIAA
jgi:hypothetical protein